MQTTVTDQSIILDKQYTAKSPVLYLICCQFRLTEE